MLFLVEILAEFMKLVLKRSTSNDSQWSYLYSIAVNKDHLSLLMEFLGVMVAKYLFGDYNSQKKLIHSKHFGSIFVNWFPLIPLPVSSALFQSLYGEKFIAKHVLMKPLLSVYPLWCIPEQSWCSLYFLLLYKRSIVYLCIIICHRRLGNFHSKKFCRLNFSRL